MNLSKLKHIISMLSILIVLHLPTIGFSENNLVFTKPITVISVTAPYLVRGSVPIPPGETATFIARVCPSDRSLRMEIVNHGKNSKGVNAEIERTYTKQKGAICVKIKAHKDTAAGSIILRAEDTASSAYNETVVKVGGGECSACSKETGCSIKPGDTTNKNSCINSMFSLGKAGHRQPAGDLILHADEPSRGLSTPAALKFSALSENVEALYLNDGSLRQVAAPQTIVDIKVNNGFSYDIRFYRPQDILKKGCLGCNRFYEFHPDAEPFVAFRIENPDADPNTYHRLRISRIKGTYTIVSEYAYNKDQDIWSLSEGNDLRISTREEEQDEQLQKRIVTETVKDGSGKAASTVKTTFNNFPWGEEIVEIVEDLNGAALTTQKNYYEDPSYQGSYGRLRSRINPDGSWIRYEYDDMGNIIREIYPWLDSPVTSQPDEARTISYDYQPVDLRDIHAPEFSHLPRKVVEKILGNTVRLNYYAYFFDASGDMVEIAERCKDPEALYGDPDNERTITSRYSYLSEGPESDRIKSIQYPEDRLDTYIYETGVYMPHTDPSLCAFVQGEGKNVRETIMHGTVDNQAGIPFNTTCEVQLLDEFDHLLMQETYVYTDTGYSRISWTVNELDDSGHVIRSYYSNGTQSESAWECCGMTFHKDTTGIIRDYLYDSLGRLTEEIKEGVKAGTWPAQSDVVTTYAYDAEGRQLSETVSAGELSQVRVNRYDLTGRLIMTIDQAGLVTNYEYDPASCVDTIIRPGGATQITTYYLDGQIKSITGTGVVPEYFTYGINADGTQWSQINTGASDSPMWQKTTMDMLGRAIKIEKPGFGGTIEYVQHHYNSKRQLVRTSTTGMADTLYVFNAPGEVIKTGLDINHNGTLDDASNDRIIETETLYTLIDNNWWQETIEQVYATEGSAEATTTNIQRTRLTGWSLGKTGESISIDIHGNQTIKQEQINLNKKTVTNVTNVPNSKINQVVIVLNGFQMSVQNESGIVKTFIYDALGREIGSTDPRTGTSTIHYNDRGQVDCIVDAAGNRTKYVYDSDSGHQIAEFDALDKVKRYAYNDMGKMTHIWGDATYPVQYVYDRYGRLERMYTYQNGSNWNAETWPTGSTEDGDETRWIYDEATGLLMSKIDAQDKGVSYTYTMRGELARRTWARMDGNTPIVTTYSYSQDTGELLSIDYSDDTPDITFTYDRLGRQKTINDATGTRTFNYNDTLQLESESINGLINHIITRNYETDGFIGRSTGFTLDSDYAVTYGYDDLGRLNTVGWNIGGVNDMATYTYMPNADLLYQMTTDTGASVTYTYEAQRDFRTQIRNEFNGTLISQYDYEYDELGRRASDLNSGQAFSSVDKAFNLYNYNDRNELIESSRYIGSDTNDISQPVPSEYRNYLYDNIGNRQQTTDWDEMASSQENQTYTTNELNQYRLVVRDSGSPQVENLKYDDDGNLISISSEGKTKHFIFNAENRLIIVEPESPQNGDNRVEFVYDYMGRRVVKRVYNYSSGAWGLVKELMFIYDNWNMIQEDISENGETRLISYVWGQDLSRSVQGAGGVGGLLAYVDSLSGNTYDYCYDVNGNVGQVINAADGIIAAYYEYDPYRNQIVAVGTAAEENPFRFSTKYWDQEVELYYFGYRYYSPELGRWLRRDPIGEFGGKNLYLFISNRPITLIDFLGLACCGPDVTNSINSEMSRLKNLMTGLPLMPTAVANPGIWFTNYLKKLLWFKKVALAMDYADQDLEGDGCPTRPECDNTITLCKKCVYDDLPGNILFGYAANLAGFSDLLRNRAADIAEFLDTDEEWTEPPDDKKSFDLGSSLVDKDSKNICDVADSFPQTKLGHENCRPCGKKPKNFKPADFPKKYPKYRSFLPW